MPVKIVLNDDCAGSRTLHAFKSIRQDDVDCYEAAHHNLQSVETGSHVLLCRAAVTTRDAARASLPKPNQNPATTEKFLERTQNPGMDGC
jgi:hypothetical protein